MTRLVLAAAFLLAPALANAQGCTQCRDNAAATPPTTQSAYREAIFFLAGTTAAVLTATAIIVKRHR